ncbi:substrate-binding domain-containing protein [Streptomyces sp. NBC_00846]|nr:substrate-binding domain-containing protein [Streptomyces sp. NBC_00846]
MARVAGLARLACTAVRDAAFDGACHDAGLSRPTVVHTGEEGTRATRKLLIAPERPTAVVYDNDIMAVAALPVTQELPLAVPRDLPVVARDDSPVTQVVRPQLTAPTRDIAAYGARGRDPAGNDRRRCGRERTGYSGAPRAARQHLPPRR